MTPLRIELEYEQMAFHGKRFCGQRHDFNYPVERLKPLCRMG